MLSAVKESAPSFWGTVPCIMMSTAQGDISDAMQIPEVDFATRTVVRRILLYTEPATYLYLCTFIKYLCALFPA